MIKVIQEGLWKSVAKGGQCFADSKESISRKFLSKGAAEKSTFCRSKRIDNVSKEIVCAGRFHEKIEKKIAQRDLSIQSNQILGKNLPKGANGQRIVQLDFKGRHFTKIVLRDQWSKAVAAQPKVQGEQLHPQLLKIIT